MKFKTDNLWQRGTGGADSVEDSADSEESPDFPCAAALHLKHIASKA